MQILQTIISYLAIAAAFVSSLFSWGEPEMVPFKNGYKIPESIPEYSTIPTEPKTDWNAKWIWDKDNLTQKNVWMCFSEKVNIAKKPESLLAHIAADSKYRLYINGETVIFEGGVKRGPEKDGSYYDSIDIAPYLQTGENVICALVWYWDNETSYSYHSSGQGGFLFEAENGDISILSDLSIPIRESAKPRTGLQHKPCVF